MGGGDCRRRRRVARLRPPPPPFHGELSDPFSWTPTEEREEQLFFVRPRSEMKRQEDGGRLKITPFVINRSISFSLSSIFGC